MRPVVDGRSVFACRQSFSGGPMTGTMQYVYLVDFARPEPSAVTLARMWGPDGALKVGELAMRGDDIVLPVVRGKVPVTLAFRRANGFRSDHARELAAWAQAGFQGMEAASPPSISSDP